MTDRIEPQAFLVAEFDALRREIELKIKETREFLRYAILSSGAIWAWLLSQPDSRISNGSYAYFIPAALSLLLFGETVALQKNIGGLAKYIRRIEASFALPEGLGWETQLATGAQKRTVVQRWSIIVWSFLCSGNMAAAVLEVFVFKFQFSQLPPRSHHRCAGHRGPSFSRSLRHTTLPTKTP